MHSEKIDSIKQMRFLFNFAIDRQVSHFHEVRKGLLHLRSLGAQWKYLAAH